MCKEMSLCESPLFNLFMVESASEVPARNTNVGAHQCVMKRDRNVTVSSEGFLAGITPSSPIWVLFQNPVT